MPFKSERQRRWMWANHPEMARKWEDEEEDRKDENIVRIPISRLSAIIREEVTGDDELSDDEADLLTKLVDDAIGDATDDDPPGELGRKVWADRARHHSRHWGDEPDTDKEAELWQDFYRYMIDDNPMGITQEDVDDIIRYSGDPRYSDVFKKYSPNGGLSTLYRGIRLYQSQVEKLIGVTIPQFWDQQDVDNSPLFSVDFTYTPSKFHRRGIISSWSDDYESASDFAVTGKNPWILAYTPTHASEKHGQGRNVIGVVLVTDASDGLFLDIKPMYDYDGLDQFDDENEVIGLGDVDVIGLKIVNVPNSLLIQEYPPPGSYLPQTAPKHWGEQWSGWDKGEKQYGYVYDTPSKSK